METKIARGIGTSGVFGGTMLDIFEGRLVAFERHGDKIYFVKRQHRFHGENDESAARAVDLSFGSSILQSADIESIRDDGATVIDVHNWMVSDLSNISQRMTGAASAARGSQNRVSFDRSRSYLESVDTYPRNVNIQAKLTFSPQQPININSVPDSRYLPVSIHYTMAALPDTPMTPWIDDDRTGFFPHRAQGLFARRFNLLRAIRQSVAVGTGSTRWRLVGTARTDHLLHREHGTGSVPGVPQARG